MEVYQTEELEETLSEEVARDSDSKMSTTWKPELLNRAITLKLVFIQ
jgi:hypothetical protein